MSDEYIIEARIRRVQEIGSKIRSTLNRAFAFGKPYLKGFASDPVKTTLTAVLFVPALVFLIVAFFGMVSYILITDFLQGLSRHEKRTSSHDSGTPKDLS